MGNINCSNSYSKLPLEDDIGIICYKYECQMTYNIKTKIMVCNCNNIKLNDDERLYNIYRFNIPELNIGFHCAPNFESNLNEIYIYPEIYDIHNKSGFIERISKITYKHLIRISEKHNNKNFYLSKKKRELIRKEIINLNNCVRI
jgi:hypothetical protein